MSDANWMRAIENTVYARVNDGESRPDLRGLFYIIPDVAEEYGQILTEREIEIIDQRVTKRCGK